MRAPLLALVLLACSSAEVPVDSPRLSTPAQFARCADDALEPNDSLEEAREWQPGDYVVTAASNDVFEFLIDPGYRLEIDATFSHADGWGGIELLDEDGQPLDANVQSPYGGSKLLWLNTSNEVRRVFARTQVYEGDCDTYSLTWWSYPAACEDDLYRDNGTYRTAAPFASGQYAVVELDDPDYWITELPPHSMTWVNIVQPWSYADLRLGLFDDEENLIVFGETSGFLSNDTDAPVHAVTRVSIHNYANRGFCAPYLLEKRVSFASCPEEELQDDVLEDARPVGVGTTSGDVRFRDPDWYRVTVPPHQRMAVEVDVDPLLGRVFVSTHDEAGMLLRATNTWPYGLSLDNPTDAPLDFHVQVQSEAAFLGCTPFDLDLEAVHCEREDVLEPNDTLALALPMPEGELEATVSEDDRDVWSLGTVLPREVVEVDLAFRESLGRVEGQLVLATGTLVDDGTGEWGEESLSWRNTTSDPKEVFLTTAIAPVHAGCTQTYSAVWDVFSP